MEFSLAVVKFLEFCLFELTKAEECYSTLAFLFWCFFSKCFSEVFHFNRITLCSGLEPWLMWIRWGVHYDIVDFRVSIFSLEIFIIS